MMSNGSLGVRAFVLPIDLELDERVDGANGLMDEGSDDGSDQEDFVNGSDAGMYTDSRCAAAQYEAIYFITEVARVALARLPDGALYLFEWRPHVEQQGRLFVYIYNTATKCLSAVFQTKLSRVGRRRRAHDSAIRSCRNVVASAVAAHLTIAWARAPRLCFGYTSLDFCIRTAHSLKTVFLQERNTQQQHFFAKLVRLWTLNTC
jgi:hypothetical protein